MRSALAISEDEIVVGNVARYHPVKDHETLLRAAAFARIRYPNLRLLLTGAHVTADNQQLVRLIHKLDLGRSVSLLGPRDDVPMLMRAMDIYTSTSLGEGFPNVVGEAMASGVPCAVSAV